MLGKQVVTARVIELGVPVLVMIVLVNLLWVVTLLDVVMMVLLNLFWVVALADVVDILGRLDVASGLKALVLVRLVALVWLDGRR